MPALVLGMTIAGIIALAAGLVLVRGRFQTADGVGKILLLGPVFEAVALAIFSLEHFLAAHELMGLVPKWLPWHLFWTYFFGVALMAAAVSFLLWCQVRWAAPSLALFFLLIVLTVSLPGLAKHFHERLFWTLLVRETGFAAGAVVLAGSVWSGAGGAALVRIGRSVLAPIMIFYAVEHFLFPRFVPGVPLEKLIPEWVPAATVLSYTVGIALLAGGVGLMIPRAARAAAAGAGTVLVLLTAFFYLPIFIMEARSPQGVEGMNYVGDTLLFAATVLLAGLGVEEGSEAGRADSLRMGGAKAFS